VEKKTKKTEERNKEAIKLERWCIRGFGSSILIRPTEISGDLLRSIALHRTNPHLLCKLQWRHRAIKHAVPSEDIPLGEYIRPSPADFALLDHDPEPAAAAAESSWHATPVDTRIKPKLPPDDECLCPPAPRLLYVQRPLFEVSRRWHHRDRARETSCPVPCTPETKSPGEELPTSCGLNSATAVREQNARAAPSSPG